MLARSRRRIAGSAARCAPLSARTAGLHGSQLPLLYGSPLAALVGGRQSLQALARSDRQLSSSASSAQYEALKADFRRWLRGELGLLSLMLVAGVGGVYFYQNREDAPWKRVTRLVAQAEQSASQGDKEQALRLTLQAYDIVKRTNRHDRHLFEMAFAIAAQYETLGRRGPATKYYLDALDRLAQTGANESATRAVRSRIVTLDRIAQCYEDRGQKVAAGQHFKQAIAAYDQYNGQRALSASPRRSTRASKGESNDKADQMEVEREIPGVMYNYGRYLLSEKRLEEAKHVLRRAFRLASAAALEEDYLALIEDQLDKLNSLLAVSEATTSIDSRADTEGDA